MDYGNLLQSASDWLRWLITLNLDEPFKTGAKVVSMVGTGVTVITAITTKTFPWLRAKIESRSVSMSLGATLFTAGSIYRSIRYYIPPSCQSMDPAGGEESRFIHPVKNKLFTTLDRVLDPASKERYHFLLADSGMGKTSALINYYVRHLRRWRKKYKLAVVPLGIPNADDKIKSIEDKPNTVLFLDALDEDTLAMVDHVERLRLLLKDTLEFPRLLITCRTQFFTKDEEIPSETGIIKIHDRPAGEPAEYRFIKIYLTPFSDHQVVAYLRGKYPLWHWRKRQKAFAIVKKIPQLTARPMLLAHIDSLLNTSQNFLYSFQLYEEMVNGWIEREKGFVQESNQLRAFSEMLAVNLFFNRKQRRGEFITKNEIKALAKEWGITINEDKLSGRGLLNRDAVGNFKFAHRSIMEYLFVARFIKSIDTPEEIDYPSHVEWTDQMMTFFWEITESNIHRREGETVHQRRTTMSYIYSYERYHGLLIDVIRHRLISFPINWGEPTHVGAIILFLCQRILSSNLNAVVDVRLYVAKKESFVSVKILKTDLGFSVYPVEREYEPHIRANSVSLRSRQLIKKTVFIPHSPVLVDDFNVDRIPSYIAGLDGAALITASSVNLSNPQPESFEISLASSRLKIEGTDMLIPLKIHGGKDLGPQAVIVFTLKPGQIFKLNTLELISSIFCR